MGPALRRLRAALPCAAIYKWKPKVRVEMPQADLQQLLPASSRPHLHEPPPTGGTLGRMALEEPIEPGDRVQLRHGGPKMRVIDVSGELCYCNWVDDLGRLQQGTFEQHSLVVVDPGDSSPAPLE